MEIKKEYPVITLTDEDLDTLKVCPLVAESDDDSDIKVKLQYEEDEDCVAEIEPKNKSLAENVAMVFLILAVIILVGLALKIHMDYNSLVIQYNQLADQCLIWKGIQ